MSLENRVVPLEDRVNVLFATIVNAEGIEVETSAVADRLSQVLGYPVSASYLEELRRPGAQRPREDLLLALAQYFDMPGTFLAEHPDEYYTTYRHLTMLIAQRDKRIPFMALRANADQLSDEAVKELTEYIDSLDN
jgi:transcriptional regulator with XRE-family HTH domain